MAAARVVLSCHGKWWRVFVVLPPPSCLSAWLDDIGLPMYKPTFEAELIDAYVLHELTLVRSVVLQFRLFCTHI